MRKASERRGSPGRREGKVCSKAGEQRLWPVPIRVGQRWGETPVRGLGELEVRPAWTFPGGCSPSSPLGWLSCIQVGRQPWVVPGAAGWRTRGAGRLEVGFCAAHCPWGLWCGHGGRGPLQRMRTSPGMDPHGSHAPSLLQIQKVWGRS